MPAPFLLDTNAYARIFQNHNTRTSEEKDAYDRLMQILHQDLIKAFYISEITSMEIHSVLGKYRRGILSQRQQCTREIAINGGNTRCNHIWISHGTRKMSQKLYQDMKKMTSDIEAQRGDIQATILALDSICIEEARTILTRYADKYNFGSHDALIAGSLLAKKQEGLNLTLVTSDKGFKNVLANESINFYDPLNPS